MSITLTLTSAAIIAGISISSVASLAVIGSVSNGTFDSSEGIETMFVDSEILLKTLTDFDCHFDVISENEYLVKTTCGNIRYARENVSQAFKIYLDEIDDVEGLMKNLESFEIDYERNVQSYTYNHIKENLSDGMRIDNEKVLDDDSLLLTINIE